MPAANAIILLAGLAAAQGPGSAPAEENPSLALGELLSGRAERWLCRRVYEHPAGSLRIERLVEDRGRTVAESVDWNSIGPGGPRFQAGWRFGAPASRRPAATRFSGEVPLSRPPSGPVRLSLVVDGRRVDSAAPVWTDLRNASGRTVLDFRYAGPIGVPDIHGSRRLAFVATDEDGREIGSMVPALPRWKLMDRQIDRARRELAAAAWRGEAPCERERDPLPPLHPPGP